MGKLMAVWIDHERALIVALASYGMITERIASNVGKHVRLAGGSRSRTHFGPQDATDEPSRDEHHRQALRRYYLKVAKVLADAEEIYVCGPGEARMELRRILIGMPELAGKIRAIEPADKMTDRQFKARTREVFSRPRPRARRSTA